MSEHLFSSLVRDLPQLSELAKCLPVCHACVSSLEMVSAVLLVGYPHIASTEFRKAAHDRFIIFIITNIFNVA